ncbi:uncharacterized protein LOC121591868 [Anopheles merus]|uniref:uncharacterized protein LOC121591868 n=1 Tax=Anopheles merus TaxID=30066 RepID=UPI001BE4A894|nr:uncharacterized protein LOC121591868 [Anopheles merus]
MSTTKPTPTRLKKKKPPANGETAARSVKKVSAAELQKLMTTQGQPGKPDKLICVTKVPHGTVSDTSAPRQAIKAEPNWKHNPLSEEETGIVSSFSDSTDEDDDFSELVVTPCTPVKTMEDFEDIIGYDVCRGEIDDDTPIVTTRRELREIIKDAFQTHLRPINTRLASIEGSIGLLLNSVAVPNDGEVEDYRPTANSFEFKIIDNSEDLELLNERLETDEEYAKQLLQWLQARLCTNESKKRMSRALSAMFTLEFLCTVTWTGKGKQAKLAMSRYKAVIQLFKTIGTTRHCTIDDRAVADFFIVKLRYTGFNLKRQKDKK